MTQTNKRGLFIYPHNFFEKTNGVNRMFYYFAKFLSESGHTIDLFTLKNFESKWEVGYPFDDKIISNVYFYDTAKVPKISIKNRILNKLKRSLFHSTNKQDNKIIQNLPDYASPLMREELIKILSKNKYSYIVVGYAYWANLLKDLNIGNTKKIISVNDWLTVQMKDYFHGNINIVNFLKDEIERINLFDVAIEISTFEHHLFSQVATHPKHYLVPIFLETKNINKNKTPAYDIAFVAHKNNYNVEGIKWFIREVLPIIPKTKLLIVGKVNSEIGKIKNQNVTQIEYIENLDDVYKNSKLIICPLFGGTGLKVKIIEALSYGTPVVCTPQSLVGFPYESNNGISVANNQVDFAKYITRLTSDHKLLNHESLNAKQYFSKYFSVESATNKLKEIFNQNDKKS